MQFSDETKISTYYDVLNTASKRNEDILKSLHVFLNYLTQLSESTNLTILQLDENIFKSYEEKLDTDFKNNTNIFSLVSDKGKILKDEIENMHFLIKYQTTSIFKTFIEVSEKYLNNHSIILYEYVSKSSKIDNKIKLSDMFKDYAENDTEYSEIKNNLTKEKLVEIIEGYTKNHQQYDIMKFSVLDNRCLEIDRESVETFNADDDKSSLKINVNYLTYLNNFSHYLFKLYYEKVDYAEKDSYHDGDVIFKKLLESSLKYLEIYNKYVGKLDFEDLIEVSGNDMYMLDSKFHNFLVSTQQLDEELTSILNTSVCSAEKVIEHDRIDLKIGDSVEYENFVIPLYEYQHEMIAILTFFEVWKNFYSLFGLTSHTDKDIESFTNRVDIFKEHFSIDEFEITDSNNPVENMIKNFENVVDLLKNLNLDISIQIPKETKKAKRLSDYPFNVSKKFKKYIPMAYRNVINLQEIVEICRKNERILEDIKLEYFQIINLNFKQIYEL